MPSTPTPWYRFQRPSKKEWTVVVTTMLASLLLFGTWEVLGLPEQSLPFIIGGAGVGVGLLIRFLTRKKP